MIGIQWDVPASLTTTAGTLNFNTFPGLILDPHQCAATKEVRATNDPIPQGDGDIFHRRWLTGYIYKLVAQAFTDESTASCLDDGRLLLEELALHLEAMRNSPGRYCWLPSNYGDTRALDQAQWLTGVTQTLAEGGIIQVEFEIDSPFPYVIDLTQISTNVPASTLITIANLGNITFYPVIQVQGPATNDIWTVNNTTTGDGIVYDQTRPGAVTMGGGDYAEIDTFKNTIYLNGNQADMSAGIDPTQSVFLTLEPGNNVMETTDVSAVFLTNNAWA